MKQQKEGSMNLKRAVSPKTPHVVVVLDSSVSRCSIADRCLLKSTQKIDLKNQGFAETDLNDSLIKTGFLGEKLGFAGVEYNQIQQWNQNQKMKKKKEQIREANKFDKIPQLIQKVEPGQAPMEHKSDKPKLLTKTSHRISQNAMTKRENNQNNHFFIQQLQKKKCQQTNNQKHGISFLGTNDLKTQTGKKSTNLQVCPFKSPAKQKQSTITKSNCLYLRPALSPKHKNTFKSASPGISLINNQKNRISTLLSDKNDYYKLPDTQNSINPYQYQIKSPLSKRPLFFSPPSIAASHSNPYNNIPNHYIERQQLQNDIQHKKTFQSPKITSKKQQNKQKIDLNQFKILSPIKCSINSCNKNGSYSDYFENLQNTFTSPVKQNNKNKLSFITKNIKNGLIQESQNIDNSQKSAQNYTIAKNNHQRRQRGISLTKNMRNSEQNRIQILKQSTSYFPLRRAISLNTKGQSNSKITQISLLSSFDFSNTIVNKKYSSSIFQKKLLTENKESTQIKQQMTKRRPVSLRRSAIDYKTNNDQHFRQSQIQHLKIQQQLLVESILKNELKQGNRCKQLKQQQQQRGMKLFTERYQPLMFVPNQVNCYGLRNNDSKQNNTSNKLSHKRTVSSTLTSSKNLEEQLPQHKQIENKIPQIVKIPFKENNIITPSFALCPLTQSQTDLTPLQTLRFLR